MTHLSNISRTKDKPAPSFAHDGTRRIKCCACLDQLHRDDFKPEYFPAKANYCEGYFGGPVCTSCMDAWEAFAPDYDDGFIGYTIGGGA